MRDLVAPMARAAVAAGADGLIIEVHHDPVTRCRTARSRSIPSSSTSWSSRSARSRPRSEGACRDAPSASASAADSIARRSGNPVRAARCDRSTPSGEADRRFRSFEPAHASAKQRRPPGRYRTAVRQPDEVDPAAPARSVDRPESGSRAPGTYRSSAGAPHQVEDHDSHRTIVTDEERARNLARPGLTRPSRDAPEGRTGGWTMSAVVTTSAGPVTRMSSCTHWSA